MTVHRCFVSPDEWNAGVVSLSQEESHHLVKVLRAVPGDEVFVFDGQGRQAPAKVVSLDPATLELTAQPTRATPSVLVTIVQALPKGKRMDWIVEKATELGVAMIYPVTTERVVTKIAKGQGAVRCERWRRLAVSAAKQCGTPWVPDIRYPADYREVIEHGLGLDLLLVGSLAPGVSPLRHVLESKRELIRESAGRIGVIIGPEGDLTEEETELAISDGAVPVSFGKLVLRVDTAAIFAASCLSYEFAELAVTPSADGA